jgi:membrane protein
MNILKNYYIKSTITILKETFSNFISDRGFKLSASLSYYTIFSIAPLLLLIISSAGFFFGEDAIRGKIFSELNGILGNEAAAQIQEVIKNTQLSGETNFALAVGFGTLIFAATTVFGEIQDSMNIIWKLKVQPKRGWLKFLKDRLQSSSIILGLGFLMIVLLLVNGILVALNQWLINYFPDITVVVFKILNIILSFGVMTVLFGTIFKVLPDAHISWKEVKTGAFFTACLFMVGRFLIGLYIQTTNTGLAYGAAGSIIVILVWVYYTAAILYLGAQFTRAYANFMGILIRPASYAVFIQEIEVSKVDNLDT